MAPVIAATPRVLIAQTPNVHGHRRALTLRASALSVRLDGMSSIPRGSEQARVLISQVLSRSSVKGEAPSINSPDLKGIVIGGSPAVTVNLIQDPVVRHAGTHILRGTGDVEG